ncbi:MAG: HipA domain-containing protein [Candidatus Riflebacteria bacterium]|nr:HipA domain-containing protein [Candidatus Riflebacteria bacterium]
MGESRVLPPSHLEVFVQKVLVGTLHRDQYGRTWFLPDEPWSAGGQRPRLGLSFLRDPSPRTGSSGIPVWFDNLLPEAGSPLRRRICQQTGIRETNTLALLRELGLDLPGAVEVRGPDVGDIEARGSDVAPGKLRFSLAGLQLKLSMVLSKDRFALPARGESGHWIVKIPGDSLPDLPQIEHVTMAWARSMGFVVPRTMVVPIDVLQGLEPDFLEGPKQVLAVERFDRLPGGGRVHQEDFAQVLEVEAVHKYADARGRRTSYDLLARQVADACGSDARCDFMDRVAFILASGNGDAHLKNWSFQWGDDPRPSLSPVYDQVATVSWPSIDGWDLVGGARLALALGQTRRAKDVDKVRLKTFCKRAGSAGEVDRMLSTLERARERWRAVESEAPPSMRQALVEHWRRVPILRHVGGLDAATKR